MTEGQTAVNRGYLNEEFRLYHLKDSRAQEIEYHYHEFDKIVIFLSGNVSYIVEGKTYYLQPWDVLFIRHSSIHRPVIDKSDIYERIVLWMNKDFLDEHSSEGSDLSYCFELSEKRRRCLFRPAAEERRKLGQLLEDLENAVKSSDFGSGLLSRIYFLHLMVELNRRMMRDDPDKDAGAFDVDPKVDEVLRYINGNLQEDLSIEALSQRFYISRYHFMRRFREAAGYTIHNYVLQKRLSKAAELISSGMNATEAALTVGFSDYSAFLRSFKLVYNLTPRQFADWKRGKQ